MLVKLIDSPNDPVRLAFVHVFTKRAGMTNADGSKSPDKFEITPILKPGGENAKKVQAAIEAVAKEKFGTKMVKDEDGNDVPAYKAILAEFADDQKGLRKGNLKKTKGGEIYNGFEGNLYVVAKNETRPTVLNRDRSPLTAEDGVLYGGCYGNVHIDVWALNKQGLKKRIVMDLTGVQFTRDGDAFGSSSPPASSDDFDDLSAADDDNSSSSSMMDD